MLGAGTIWFGRRWPMDNERYVDPTADERDAFLDAYLAGVAGEGADIMLDCAAAYGHAEARLGAMLAARPSWRDRLIVATKWGEDFDVDTETSVTDHSVDRLHASFDRSVQRLGQVDLLYIHRALPEVLQDQAVLEAMVALRSSRRGGLSMIGASISRRDSLALAAAGLGVELDVVQMPAWLFFERPDDVDALARLGLAIVVNGPYRTADGLEPRAAYTRLLQAPQAPVILTGTRHHLMETLDFL